jgi:ABC-type lipoprotein export system ATPase subunit
MTVLRCRKVTRRYERRGLEPVIAVDRADLELNEGEFIAIQGPSGSGKTTLLGLLAGLELPDDGQIDVLGHDLRRLSPTERARLRQRRLGIVFQSFGLVASLSAGENVALPLALARIPETDRHERAEAALREVGLIIPFDARVDELSGGERQRIGVARALASDPTVVLADEPTGSLDAENGRIVLDLLSDAVRRRGIALVLVTHDPLSAARADRRYQILDGRLRPEDAA